jgi:hypothetical protein
MNELDQVFDGDLAERTFFIISAIFAIVYAAAIILMPQVGLWYGRTVFRRKKKAAALLIALAMSAVASGFWGLRASSRDAVNPASVSVTELQNKVDMKTLPEQEVGDLF